jgi:hypothetical protein
MNSVHFTLLRLPPVQEFEWTRIDRDGGGSNSWRGGKDSRGRGGRQCGGGISPMDVSYMREEDKQKQYWTPGDSKHSHGHSIILILT